MNNSPLLNTVDAPAIVVMNGAKAKTCQSGGGIDVKAKFEPQRRKDVTYTHTPASSQYP